MSVIFEDVENLHYLQFQFTQAVRLGKSLYYIQNELLRKVNMIENHFDDSDSVIVQAEVSMICTDGKSLFSLLQNGDIYSVEQPPRLLNSGHHYQWISPTAAIDHSNRGYFWRTHKQIYSHCKHISTCGDRLTLITIGGKIFNIQSEQAIPIPQLNGLKLNTYFKKSLLFNFGGVTVTESGDLYLFNAKLLRIKIKDIEDIFATEKHIIALQGNNTILQFQIDDIKSHQFFTNQQIFQKMHYCNDIEFPFKKKSFLSVQILQTEYSMSCFALIKDNKVLDTSLNITEKTMHLGNRSSVMIMKQSLFDEWDVRKKPIESRRSTTTDKQFETLPAERQIKPNLECDGLSMTQKLATIRESLNFDRATPQDRKTPSESIRGSEIKESKQSERNRQKSLIQLHHVIVDDVVKDIPKSPQPIKLDNLLNKIHVIKPEKTLDNLIQNQNRQDDSLPTFQCEDQFTHNDTMTKKKPPKSMNSRSNKRQDSLSCQSGIDVQSSSEFMQQQDSFIEILSPDKTRMDLPLQFANFDKTNKFKKKTLDTIQSNENEQEIKTTNRLSIKKELVLQQSNRSPKKSNREIVMLTERSSTIEQAKQDLENLVNIITKQKETNAQKVPKLRVNSPPVGVPISRPESKVTPLKNRRSSCESSQSDSLKMPSKIIKQTVSSKMNTQQSFSSSNQSQFQFDSHHFKPINTQQDQESQLDLKSAKTIFDQSMSKKSEKLLKKVSCSSLANPLRSTSMSKKTSIIANQPTYKPPIDRKKQAILSKLFFRFDVRIKFHKLEFLNTIKYML